LDRAQRCELLARARAHWKDTTLLCVTHDVADTADFSRVLLVEGGRIVEDGAPAELAALEGSRYRAMLEADKQVRAALWDAVGWRWLRLVRGRLEERERREG
jgi:ATP-binding cassette subfamily B protein